MLTCRHGHESNNNRRLQERFTLKDMISRGYISFDGLNSCDVSSARADVGLVSVMSIVATFLNGNDQALDNAAGTVIYNLRWKCV